jgi:tRNA modification GTPase
MYATSDTIAAIATPPGRGGVGIVRVSGPAVPAIARALFGHLPQARQAGFHGFRDAAGQLIDRGLAVLFEEPASFTGEHVLELHGHGGPVVLDMLLQRVMELGARPARPGEFSERAFLNDKLDLAQAEAIADLIDSASAQAARAAMQSLEGVFSEQVHALVETLTQLRMYVEAAIDFPDEEIDLLSDNTLRVRLDDLQERFAGLQARSGQGRLLRDGMTLVIAGRPNAGKSSLLNALSGAEVAIVTEIPGTTRDVLREHILLNGLPVHVLDTAGLHDSADPVEVAGMQRARAALQQADHILLVIDDTAGYSPADAAIEQELPSAVPLTRVYNKIDSSARPAGPFADRGHTAVALSAKHGDGLPALRELLMNSIGYTGLAEGGFSARRRHLDALARAAGHVQSGIEQLESARAGELLAEELRLAQEVLGEITGVVSSDELLGLIFSSFCIGK